MNKGSKKLFEKVTQINSKLKKIKNPLGRVNFIKNSKFEEKCEIQENNSSMY